MEKEGTNTKIEESTNEEVEVIVDLSEKLSKQNIENIQNILEVPSGIRENIGSDPVDFLYALKEEWGGFRPGKFHIALHAIGRADLVPIASRIPWLCKPPGTEKEIDTTRNTETFVKLLKSELASQNWKLILRNLSVKVIGEVKFENAIEKCVEKVLFTSDLETLCSILQRIKRLDLIEKLIPYKSTFSGVSDKQLNINITSELRAKKAKDNEWQIMLRKFILKENKDVSAVLDEKPVPIEMIFTPLTVVKVQPAEERYGEESGISEIDFLRKMHDNVAHDTVEVVEFENIVTNSDSSRHQVWCMIGSPGSGKSFLCQHLAHMYGTHQLPNFQYTISIPCRSQEWHRLEEARHEGENIVDGEFIVNWLSLSMSIGAKWSDSLSEHLLKSDGEGLFIILDGADEFTRKVPFEATLLSQLLKRRFLTLSTVLVTSRPGSWSDILFEYGTEFNVDANFQVLGFSPTNRDLYFEKRIANTDKLSAVHQMFDRHDEIKQLSLVPVNASLFSALFNQSKSILSQTLSHLYMQLVTYIIRRQLWRMNLVEHSKVKNMPDFHPGILECIHAIGEEANQGIFERKLTSDKSIFLKIGGKAFQSERLGLMQSHVKVLSLGHRVKVWTFQHLTIQEFMGALSISNNTWTNRCFIVRYITSSNQYVSMYKMVVRFIAGILRQDAGRITPILCRHLLPNPMSLIEAPMLYQLYFYKNLVDYSDWREFTQSYLLLCTVICEINTDAICDHFAYFKKQFAYRLNLYFLDTISPNEWHCFLQSLPYVKEFQILCIYSDFVTPVQFRSLLTLLASCSLHYLALGFDGKDHDTIHSYTNLLTSATLPSNTRISIKLRSCDLTDSTQPEPLFSSTNHFVGSLMIYESVIHEKTLQNLTNQFSSFENLFYRPKSDDSNWAIIRQLITTHQVNGLFIQDRNGFLPLTPSILSGISSLQELEWLPRKDSYQVVPYISNLSSLTSLQLFSSTAPPSNESLREPLTNLISTNSSSLRQINLNFLHRVGFHSWSSYFSCVASCSNLMVLHLHYTEFSSEDISCWYRAVSALKSLVYLGLTAIPLQDSGMLVVCHSLSYHRAIRCLYVEDCDLSSASCRPLMCLIQTLPYMRLLKLSKPELTNPDPTQLQLLIQTAAECSVKIQF